MKTMTDNPRRLFCSHDKGPAQPRCAQSTPLEPAVPAGTRGVSAHFTGGDRRLQASRQACATAPLETAVPAVTRPSMAGFTLVEVALAIVVVAIGMMAAFSLIGTGMRSSSRAVGETRAAIFADDVFNALRSKSVLALDEGAGEWERFWEDFSSYAIKVDVAGGPLWQYDVTVPPPWPPGLPTVTNYLQVAASRPDIIRTIVFTNYSIRTGSMTEHVNHALRYQLFPQPNVITVSPIGSAWTNSWTSSYTVVLNVWEGEFGEASISNAMTFSTEFPNSGGL